MSNIGLRQQRIAFSNRSPGRILNRDVETVKIVHISSVHVASDTRILHRECRSLAAAGHSVTLVVAGEQPGNMKSTIDGVNIVWIPVRVKGRIQRMLRTAQAVTDYAAGLQADLYHLHDPELLLWAHRLRAKGRPVVFDMHEYLPGAIMDKPWIPVPLRPLVRFASETTQRFLLTGMPVIFAEDSYPKHYPWVPQWVIVRNFPSVEQIAKYVEDPAEGFRIGYLGGVTAVRGSATMIRAVHLLQQEGVDASFECIGHAGAAHREELEQLIASLGVRNVTLHGRLQQSEALPILARCRVGLAILRDRPNYRESYPTKMFEYMALKMPVIVSDFPLYRSIVDKYGCGFCVPPEDPRELAIALRVLAEDPNLAAAIGRNGDLAVRSHFSWRSEFAKLESLYDAVGTKVGHT